MTRPTARSRNVRVPDQLWAAAQQAATARGETVSEAIRRLLHQYVRETQEAQHGRDGDPQAGV